MWHIAACGKLSQANTGAAIAKIASNYAKAKYIGWFTFFPGFDVSPTPIDMTRLNKLFDGKTHTGTRRPWSTSRRYKGGWCSAGGENASLRAWKVNANLTLTFLASSDETASPNTGDVGGMPSGRVYLANYSGGVDVYGP
ncbi:hypothetical protein [Nitrosospira sp. Nsp1]|uniref:hypothetical protein n=1 Tax=Nitrosospira sp. Nsp1 TaxID=136547 RepID=UPI00088E9FC0|nr:hypothetical protein [Nitrosospira sp. Nsp1]SCX38543.1 hypothetical protein SAMN05720354_10235 [Nitrosospira sp. Nsp1]